MMIMGDVDGRNAQLLLNAANFGAHADAELGVQIRQRLVEQQYARLYHQRAGQRHALLLAAGKLVGHAALHAAHFYQLQNRLDPSFDLGLGHFAQAQAVSHVVKHVVMREQGVALEHHGGVALVGGQGIDGFAAQIDFALVRAFESCHHAQGCGLTAAGRAQQGHEAARLNIQRNVMYGIEVLAGLGILVNLGNMVKANAFALFRHFRCPPLAFCWFQNA